MLRRYLVLTGFFAALAALFLLENPVDAHREGGANSIRHKLVVTASQGEQSMEIYGFSHEVISPRDAGSGLPTGKRQHRPITIRKAVDASSPLLQGWMLEGVVFPDVTIQSYRRERGRWTEFRTIRLADAFVSSFGQKPDSAQSASDAPEIEELAFAYRRIKWEYEPSGTEHEDQWKESQ